MSKADCDPFPLKKLMLGVVARAKELFDFWQLALSTNLFGLGCPLHCGSPSWAALTCAFLLGLFTGFALALTLAAWIYFRLLPQLGLQAIGSQLEAACPPSRLRGYLA